MSGILIKEGNSGPVNETFEKSILRKVIRESWQSGEVKNTTDPRISQMLEEHASKMEKILGDLNYGALCMPNVIANSRKMSYGELVSYLSLLESLGMGYKQWFNSEFANIFLAGLTLKARDTHSASRHLDGFLSGIERRLCYYKGRSEKESKSLNTLMMELNSKNSGLLRFFRKREISLLKRMINMKSKRTESLSRKRARYANIVVKVKGPRKLI